MTENRITVIKSPIVPFIPSVEGKVTYWNQATYSVRLTNGMVVTRPEEFPDAHETQGNLPRKEVNSKECTIK